MTDSRTVAYDPLADAATPLLELTDAVVRRNGRDILTVDHLTIMAGDQVAILGPNGAGKSTFVKLLTREMAPLWREEPPVRFCGDPRPEVARMRKILGVVSSSMQDQITVHLPVIDIVVGGLFGTLGIPRWLAGEVTDEMRQRALDLLKRLHADHLAERTINTLSNGQARRVLLARALINDPQVVVLDEPCVGLDPEGMWYVRQALSGMARAGHTVLLVTHAVEDIRPEFNRVLLIKDGRIAADGPKQKILTTSNMQDLFGIPVEVEEHEGLYHLW